MGSQYKYTYENTSDYCYPNTNTLINILNITDDNDLHIAEQELVGLRVKELIETPIQGNFDFKHLKDIHYFLFQDIYKWAGKIRTCNIAKKDLFCLAQYIDSYAEEVFYKLEKRNYYIELDYQDKVQALAELFADINALHPFREGNGRTQREFIKGLAKVNGIYLDFTQVDSMDMIIASSESINGNINKLSSMFKKIASPIASQEQLEYIDIYMQNQELKDRLKSNMK